MSWKKPAHSSLMSVALVWMVLRILLAGPTVLLLQLQSPSEEVQAHHRRLAALERHDDLVGTDVGLEQLRDVGLVDSRVHAEAAAGVQLLFGEEEAVVAVQVADRAGGFAHHVEDVRRGVRHICFPPLGAFS